MAAYEQALRRLYQAPLSDFLAERKRLSHELAKAGDASGAREIAKRRRPTTSVWAVNQLHGRERAALDDMLATAARVRRGELRATRALHDEIAELRKKAGDILREAGLGAGDSTLRRVATTLAALAASGGFAPDPPGALSADRDPPGFEAMDLPERPSRAARGLEPATGRTRARADAAERRAPAASAAERRKADRDERKRAAEERARVADEERRARRARETERARVAAERRRLQSELRGAARDVERRRRAVSELEAKLAAARRAESDARRTAEELQRALAALATRAE
ncbi:MAG TPA: hypothetical protein VFD92_19305 [Candidatus Binatia bacterium]|nr:hypothetical protein [Candidatus Binatia bacterium]